MPKTSLNPVAKVFVSGSKAGTTAKVDLTVAEFVPRPTILDALVVSFMGQGNALESRVPASISYTESRNYFPPLTRLNPCAATFVSNASLADDEEMIDAKDFLDFVEEPTSPKLLQQPQVHNKYRHRLLRLQNNLKTMHPTTSQALRPPQMQRQSNDSPRLQTFRRQMLVPSIRCSATKHIALIKVKLSSITLTGWAIRSSVGL